MKVLVKTAKSENNKFSFDFAHGTTTKFYKPSVPFIMEVRKGMSMNLQVAAMRRVDPMVLPPMSLVRFNTRFYYVPMIDICPYFNDFDERTPYAYRFGTQNANFNSEIPLKVPRLLESTIKEMFLYGLMVKPITTSGGKQYVEGAKNEYDYTEDELKYRLMHPVKIKESDVIANYPNNDYVADGVYDVKILGNYYGSGVLTRTNYVYFKFTERGRRIYNLIKQLGYEIEFNSADSISSNFRTTNNVTTAETTIEVSRNDIEFSALPLLAFTKVYLNFYESSQYINNTVRLSRLNSLLHIDKPDYVLNTDDLDVIFDLPQYITYENDYFTTAFVNPSNGNNFLENNEAISIADITTQGEAFDNYVETQPSSNGTPILTNGDDSGYLSQNSLNLIKRLTNYLRRHQVAGGRMVDRMLVEYGITVNNEYSRRSSYIDTISSVMNITPVVNTTSEQLGDYAGFGSASNDMNNNQIQINVPEQDGFIIAIDTVVPEVFYSQGYKRHTRHITKWDFVAGTDFDAVGVQAIEQGEILMTKQGDRSFSHPDTKTFGFKPRGAEYKEMYSYLTGDFVMDSVNTDIEGYFTNRFFDPDTYTGNNKEINITTGQSFVATYDSGQYSRLFYINAVGTDYIKSIFRFKIDMVAPYRELYDEYKLSDTDGNNEVNMNFGGQTLQ